MVRRGCGQSVQARRECPPKEQIIGNGDFANVKGTRDRGGEEDESALRCVPMSNAIIMYSKHILIKKKRSF